MLTAYSLNSRNAVLERGLRVIDMDADGVELVGNAKGITKDKMDDMRDSWKDFQTSIGTTVD